MHTGTRGGLRIGLLGGSFDPVHRAHTELAKAALEQFGLNEVQLLPARQPWQKPTLSAASQDRLAMLELATANLPGVTVNPIELTRPGKTYTIDTLKALPANNDYFWILGSDQLQNFPTWHRWQDIAKELTLLVAIRPGSSLAIPNELQKQIDSGLAQVQTLDFAPMSISATELRQALKQGQQLEQWLEPNVAAYISANHLYQTKDQP